MNTSNIPEEGFECKVGAERRISPREKKKEGKKVIASNKEFEIANTFKRDTRDTITCVVISRVFLTRKFWSSSSFEIIQ